VDPRNYLSGHFVRLRFDRLSEMATKNCRRKSSGDVFVLLQSRGRTVRTVEGTKKVWEPISCSTKKPSADDRIWIRGTRSAKQNRPVFGIERFYVPETSELRTARSGQVIAKIAVNPNGNARILDLVQIRR